MALVTADWNPMGNRFYRREELYCMGWADRFQLKGHLVAAAQYGGPIALMKDEQDKASMRPVISIFTSSGHLLSSFKWKSGRVLSMAWSHREELLVIQDDGQVLIHDQHGTFMRTFSMGNDIKSLRAVSARVSASPLGTGLALLSGGSVPRFVLTDTTDNLRLRRLPETPGVLPSPSCWTVLVQGGVTRILATTGSELVVLQSGDSRPVVAQGLSLSTCRVSAISSSPSQTRVAISTDVGLVWVGSSDLETKLGEFDTRNPTPPNELMWCGCPGSGSPAVVVVWDDVLLLMSAHGRAEPVRFPVESESLLVQEIDGVRILTKYSHDFIHTVSDACVNVFKIGSMEPGALLLEASREYECGSQKADEYLRAIKEQGALSEAVSQCIEAACHQTQPRTQKTLLRAASFGKCFCPSVSPQPFVDACRHLRVLNAVRDHEIALPLSYAQLEHLTLHVLIDRLVSRRHFALAVKICELLRLAEAQGRSRVLAHWACYKVESAVPDEALALLMNRTLGDAPGLSYAEIAARATDLGRSDLAIKLLDFEPRAGEQVPLLMRLNRVDLAMMRAVQSGESDLVYMVISHLKESVNRREFFMTLRQHPAAHSLYLKCCRQLHLETLKDLYEQDDQHDQLGHVHVAESLAHPRVDARIASLNEAVMEYGKAKNEFAAKMTEDQIRLLRVQVKLQEQLESGGGGGDNAVNSLVGLPAHDTVLWLLVRGLGKLAETTARDLRLPERRMWWVKVQAFARRGEWLELEKLSRSKKSPIGYQPFVSVCLRHGNKAEAKKYIPRLAPETRVKAFLSIGDVEGAVEAALDRRSDDDAAAILGHPLAASNRRAVERLLPPSGARGGGR